MKKLIPFLILALFPVISCAHSSQGVLKKTEKPVSIEDVQKSPDSYLNRTVEWGGVIVETVRREDKTWIKVSRTDLDRAGRPTDTEKTKGLFYIVSDKALDPAEYRRDRLITAVGEIAGVQEGPLGGNLYPYPVVRAAQIQLWPEALMGRTHFYWYNDFFWWPYVSFWGRCADSMSERFGFEPDNR